MNTPLLPTLLIATLAGGVAAFVVTVFVSPGAHDRGVSATPDVGTSNPTGGESAATVAGLRKENADLRVRVATLESTVSRLAGGTGAESRAPVAVGSADDVVPQSASTRDFLDAFASEGRVPELFVARVGEALDEIRAAEEAARIEAETVAQAERVEERLVRLRDELGLSGYQMDEMRGILVAEEASRSELWSSVRDGGDRGSMRDRMRDARDELNTRLSEVLDPDQLERYQESRDRGFGGFGGGRLGGGGGGDASQEGRTGIRARTDRTRG